MFAASFKLWISPTLSVWVRLGMLVCVWPLESVSQDQAWCLAPVPRASVPAASCTMTCAGAAWSTTTPTSGATTSTWLQKILSCRNPKFPETFTEQSSCQWKITKISSNICLIRFSSVFLILFDLISQGLILTWWASRLLTPRHPGASGSVQLTTFKWNYHISIN